MSRLGLIARLAVVPQTARGLTQIFWDKINDKLKIAHPDATGDEIEVVSRKNQPNGYPGLDENGHIAYDQLGTGTPDGTQFLRDDGTWAVPPGGGGGGMADPGANGIVVRTATNTTTARSIVGTSPVTVTNGDGTGGNPTISMPAASGSQAGHLTATDWTTFSGKVGPSRSISTSAPLSGGGNLSADRSLSLSYGYGLTVSGGALVVDTSVIATQSWVGSAYQPLDSGLTSLTAADASAGLPYVTGANVWANASYSGMFSVVSGAWKVIGLRESGGTDLSIGGISGTKLLGVASNTIGGVTVGTGLSLAAGVLSLNGTSPSNTDFNPVFAKFFAITTDGDSLRGDGMTVTTGGTLAAANTTTRPFTSLSTATTLSATATAYTQTAACRMGFAGTLYFRIQTASSIASIRFWLGLRQSSGGIGTGATAGCPIACLSYDSSVSGNWRIVNKDSTTQTAVDSGVAVATNTEYYGYIRTDSSGSYLAIAVAGAALPAEVSNTSNPPSGTTDLGVSCTVVNLSAGTARRMDLNSIYYIARY